MILIECAPPFRQESDTKAQLTYGIPICINCGGPRVSRRLQSRRKAARRQLINFEPPIERAHLTHLHGASELELAARRAAESLIS